MISVLDQETDQRTFQALNDCLHLVLELSARLLSQADRLDQICLYRLQLRLAYLGLVHYSGDRPSEVSRHLTRTHGQAQDRLRALSPGQG